MILDDLDAKYTLGRNWILRIDPYYYLREYSVYNINSRRTFVISKAGHTLLSVFKRNSISYNDINKIFNDKKVRFDWEGFWDMCRQIEPFDLLVKADKPMQHVNLPDENYDISCFDIPIASSPLNVEVHLTHRCNLKCIHCFQDSSPDCRKFEELSCDEWIRIFDQLEQSKVQSVMISGGEPFFYKHFTELFSHIVSKKLNYSVLTNATLISQRDINALSQKNVALSISLDGFSEELHDRLRGKGTFKKTVGVIRDLIDNGATVTLSYTVNSINYEFLREMIEFAIEMKTQGVVFAFLEKMGRANENQFLALSTLQREVTKDIFKNLLKEFGKTIELSFIDPSSSTNNAKFSNQIYCSAGTVRAAVSADGKLYPCVHAFGYDELVIGDLLKENLLDAWRDKEKWGPYRGEIQLKDINSCSNCYLKENCNLKNCRLKSYDQGRSFHNKPNECVRDFI